MDGEMNITKLPVLHRDMFSDPKNFIAIGTASELYKAHNFSIGNMEEVLETTHAFSDGRGFITGMQSSITQASTFDRHFAVWIDGARRRFIERQEADLGDIPDSLALLAAKQEIIDRAKQLGTPDVGTVMTECVRLGEEEARFLRSVGREGIVTTGIKEIDDAIIGLLPGHLIILAARTSHGKTTLANQIMLRAEKLGTVLCNSFEMSPGDLARLGAGQKNGINTFNFNQPWTLSDSEFEEAMRVLHTMDGNRIRHVNIQDPQRLEATVATLKPKLVVIDHIQRATIPKEYRNNTAGFLAFLIKAYFNMGAKYKVPFLVLSQINRDGAEAPKLTDLKGSGALEEDSATVLILNQPNFGEQSPEGMKATLNVAKARYGFPGVTAELLLSKGNQTFYPWDPIVAAKIWERLAQAA